MIARVIVGSGTNRTNIETPRDRDTRRSIGQAIKNALFPSPALYGRAKRRGIHALEAVA